MMVMGIDPGLSGGVGWIDGKEYGCSPLVMVAKSPDLDALAGIYRDYRPDLVVVERVQGGRLQAGQLLMGINYGLLLGQIRTLGLPLLEVTPQKWKKALDLSSDKGEAILRARDWFPNATLVAPGGRKPHDGMAEALLIAEYGRRVRS